jgi:hypothetical protein
MEEQQQQPPLNPAAPAFQANNGAGGGGGKVKLSPFWPQAPALWFAQAEGQFIVKRVNDEMERYYNVVAVLPHESLRKVADIVERCRRSSPTAC